MRTTDDDDALLERGRAAVGGRAVVRASDVAQSALRLYAQLGAAGWSADDIAWLRSGYDFAAQSFAGCHCGAGKPFITHLVGTASATAYQTPDRDMVAAGLLHALYPDGRFPGAAARSHDARRAMVRERMSVRAEELINQYAHFNWSVDAVLAYAAASSPDQNREMMLLRLANEVDNQLDHAYLATPSARRSGQDVLDANIRLAEMYAFPRLAELLREVIAPPADASWFDGAKTRRANHYWLDENFADRLHSPKEARMA